MTDTAKIMEAMDDDTLFPCEKLNAVLRNDKSAKNEVDSDLPAATNKIDLLWHEMGKLLKKS